MKFTTQLLYYDYWDQIVKQISLKEPLHISAMYALSGAANFRSRTSGFGGVESRVWSAGLT